MAFDANGNLFVVRGSGNSTTVFSVTEANLAAANGARIPSSASESLPTTSDVNGVAFDASGVAYLGSTDAVTSYAMPDWSRISSLPSKGLKDSSDLASCSSPPTITLRKNVVNRVNASDQFNLSLSQQSTQLGTATTQGSATGIQDQIVGPLPTSTGVALSFSETAASGASLGDYASTWDCSAEGKSISGANGSGTSGSVTIPSGSKAVVCTFTNTPLVANVTIHKDILNASGAMTAGVGWTVGSSATAAGSVTQAPSATTQATNSSGDATWKLTFGTASSRADVAVSETQQNGYQFDSGQCTVTPASGNPTTTTLKSEAATTLTGIKPGDSVACNYVNKRAAASVVVKKVWKLGGQEYANGTQPKGLSASLSLNPAGGPSGDPTWGQTRTGFSIGDQVGIGETSTIDQKLLPGCALASATISGPGITGDASLGTPTTVMLPDTLNAYTVTNTVRCQTLTIIKEVSNTHGGTLSPSDWNGKLHASPAGGTALTFNSGEQKYVSEGRYTISEEQLAGYQLSGLTCQGGKLSSSAVTVAAGDSVICTLTNSDKPGDVSWSKADEGGNALNGSEWRLSGPNGASTEVQDCVAASADACTGPDKNPAAGAFAVSGLSWGSWTLTETKAPAGFVRDDTAHSFAISAGQLSYAFTTAFRNKQASSVTLPLTGGTGTDIFVIIGALLLLGGGAALLIRRHMMT